MKKKTRKKEIKKPDAPKPSQDTEISLSTEKPFDFGGIPERNLKKNLGCG